MGERGESSPFKRFTSQRVRVIKEEFFTGYARNPVDDTQAVLNLALKQDSDSLIMYIGGKPHGATENYNGKGVQLQVDEADKSNSTS